MRAYILNSIEKSDVWICLHMTEAAAGFQTESSEHVEEQGAFRFGTSLPTEGTLCLLMSCSVQSSNRAANQNRERQNKKEDLRTSKPSGLNQAPSSN